MNTSVLILAWICLICGVLVSDLTVLGKRRAKVHNITARSKHKNRPSENFAAPTEKAGSSGNYSRGKNNEQKEDKVNKAQKTNFDNDEGTNNEEDYGESYSENISLLYEKPTQGTKQSLKPTTVFDTTLPATTTKSRNTTGTPSMKPTEESQSTPLPQMAENSEESSGSGDQNEASGDLVGLNKHLRSMKPTSHPTEETMTSYRPTKISSTQSQKISSRVEKPNRHSQKRVGNKNRHDSDEEKLKGKVENKVKVHKNRKKAVKEKTNENERKKEKYQEDDEDEEADEDNLQDDENEKPTIKQNVEDTEKRVLCVGDSITEGYHQGGRAFYPYSRKLYELLNAENNTATYNVYNEGVSGECVYSEMMKRMPTILQKYKPLDLVIILGGTNDLNHINCSEDSLFDNIKALHEMAHKANAKTVAITIPDSNISMMPLRKERERWWVKTNEEIRKYAEGKDNVILCDLAEELPYRTMTDDERAKYWDDHLHYTPKGYDRMAEIIYDAIQGMF